MSDTDLLSKWMWHSDILQTVMHTDTYKIQSYLFIYIYDLITISPFLPSKTPDLELEALFKRNFTQVVFFKGTAMSTRDLERVKVGVLLTLL